VRPLLTGHEIRDGNLCWRPRGTPTALLVYTRTGSAVLRLSGRDDEQMISAGDAVLWAPGVPQHFGRSPGGEPWELVWAHFRPREHWHGWLKWPHLGLGVARIPAPPNGRRARIDAALLEMDGYAHSGLFHATDLALNALERALLWLDAAGPEPPRLDDRVEKAVLFVAGNLDRHLTIQAIADAVHLSPSRLTHLFTQEVGTSPARFVELRRIERAKALLESSSSSIGAISRATGFSSQHYFATRFKTTTGVSPSDWRRQARG
jgi:AraC family transcriptional regulator, arabinose operon regulatory protein